MQMSLSCVSQAVWLAGGVPDVCEIAKHTPLLIYKTPYSHYHSDTVDNGLVSGPLFFKIICRTDTPGWGVCPRFRRFWWMSGSCCRLNGHAIWRFWGMDLMNTYSLTVIHHLGF